MTLKDQYKIKRKVAEHNRQQRKEARKNPNARKSMYVVLTFLTTPPEINKDPGVPKLWGMQQDMVNKMPEQKRLQMEQRKKEEESRKRKRSDVDQMNTMMKEANKREKHFEEQEALFRDLGQFNMKGKHSCCRSLTFQIPPRRLSSPSSVK